MKFKRPPLRIQPTTLWDYPSQDYGEGQQGKAGYKGATPSYVIWNLLQRYTAEKDLVVDSFAGSGTTLDVARDLGRRALGDDVHPTRKDIFKVDARKLPPELTGKVDFVFIDPPYSTHIDYGPDPRDIGKPDASGGGGGGGVFSSPPPRRTRPTSTTAPTPATSASWTRRGGDTTRRWPRPSARSAASSSRASTWPCTSATPTSTTRARASST